MSTTSRRQDAWNDLPYDLFSAAVVQEVIAGWLGAEPGIHNHHVDVLHLDTGHEGTLDELPDVSTPIEMESLVTPMEHFDGLLADVIDGLPTGHAGWDLMAATMTSYRCWKAGDHFAAFTAADGVDGPLGQSLEAWYQHLYTTQPQAVGPVHQ